MTEPLTTSFVDPMQRAQMLEESARHEALQMYQAFALAKQDAYKQAESDLVSIRSGQVSKGELSQVRLQAAYALAYESVYSQLDDLSSMFMALGTVIPSGLMFMGMCSKSEVKPGENCLIESLAYDHLSPVRIIVADHCADAFDFIDIRSGAVSALTNADRVPCSAFTRHNHILGPLNVPTLRPNMYLTFDVINHRSVPMRFESTVFCIAKADKS